MHYSVDVEITAPVYETEVADRVAAAIREIFPTAEPTRRHGEMTATVHSMEHFSELLHRQEILDTARSVFFDQLQGEDFSFRVQKQPATQGVVTFSVDESVELGVISVHVHVHDPDVEAFIDYVAPPTEDGRPITG